MPSGQVAAKSPEAHHEPERNTQASRTPVRERPPSVRDAGSSAITALVPEMYPPRSVLQGAMVVSVISSPVTRAPLVSVCSRPFYVSGIWASGTGRDSAYRHCSTRLQSILPECTNTYSEHGRTGRTSASPVRPAAEAADPAGRCDARTPTLAPARPRSSSPSAVSPPAGAPTR